MEIIQSVKEYRVRTKNSENGISTYYPGASKFNIIDGSLVLYDVHGEMETAYAPGQWIDIQERDEV